MQIIIRMIKMRSTEWFISLVRTGKVKNILIILVGKYEGMKKFDSCRCRQIVPCLCHEGIWGVEVKLHLKHYM